MADKQLAGIDAKAVRKKIVLDHGLNAKELAVGAGIGYEVARRLFRDPTFPNHDGYVFYSDYVAWRRRGMASAQNPPTARRPRAANAGKRGAPLLTHG